MTWTLLHRYTPHALLLMVATACLAIVLTGPRQQHAPSGDGTPPRSATLDPFDDTTPMRTAQLSAEDPFDQIWLDYLKRQLMQQRQGRDESDDAPQADAKPTIDENRTSPVARPIDQTDLYPIDQGTYVLGDEYVFAPNPLAWRRPEALPQREYVILEYGEIDGEQLTENQFIAEPTATFLALESLAGNDADDADTPDDLSTGQTKITVAAVTDGTSADADVTPGGGGAASIVVNSNSSTATTAFISIQTGPITRPVQQDKNVPVTVTKTASAPPVQTAIGTRPTTSTAPGTTWPTDTASAAHADNNVKPVTDSAAVPPKSSDDSPGLSAIAQAQRKPDSTQPNADTLGQALQTPVVSTPAAEKGLAIAQAVLVNTNTNAKAQTPAPRQSDAATPSKPLPSQAVNAKAQDKPSHTPSMNNAAPTPPAQANKQADSSGTPHDAPTTLIMLIDDFDSLAPDRFKAIDRAINQINSNSNIPVRIELTTDPGSNPDLLFREDNSGNMGNMLGNARFAVTEDPAGNQRILRQDDGHLIDIPEITLNNSFNWFTGEDASAIGGNQFDYETAFLHEAFHLLGEGDDYDNQDAVSFAQLSPGETRRIPDSHEIEGLADADNFWQTLPDAAANGKAFNNVRYKSQALTAAVVPEPASLALLTCGVLLTLCQHSRPRR